MTTTRVEALVLGVLQDGGLPHMGCLRECCEAARRDPSRGGKVASLALLVDEPGAPRKVYLVDATPDIRAQVDAALSPAGYASRPKGLPVDGILLTHAHIGHYAGLIYLGRESMASNHVPVWATTRMASFLASNGPWRRLVDGGHIETRSLSPGVATPLAQGLSVEAFPVAHREEDSDAVGFLVRGPSRRLLYIPDIDTWGAWERQQGRRIERVVEDADVALLDGTFHSPEDLGTRSIAEVPHPMMTDTMDRLHRLIPSRKVHFIHLNHSNPALNTASPERRALEARGFSVAAEGMRIPL